VAFNLYFAGIEQGTQRNLLEAVGETHGALSFWGLKRRLPKTKPYRLEDRFPSTFEIFLDSGGYSANKTPGTVEELEEYAAVYQAFVADNIDRAALVTEFDCLALGQDWIELQRSTFWADMPHEKFVPVWHASYALEELARLAQVYDHVAIPESALQQHTNLAQRVNMLQVKYGTQFHALACAKPDNLHSVRFDSAVTTSWFSPMKYGETIVWQGNKLHRYTAAYKEQARKRHKMDFTAAGFDAEKIIADDPMEVAKFTLWSFRQLEMHVDKRRPPVNNNPFTVIQGGGEENVADNNDHELTPSSGETPGSEVDTFAQTLGNAGSRLPVARSESERVLLPVVGFTTGTPTGDADGSVLLTSGSGDSLRRCDFCYVSENCPAFKPGAECAYKLPVEIKTKEQLGAAMQVLLEMQLQRVAFLRMAEDLNGGAADPNLSQEIDRTFKLFKTQKEILDNSSYTRMVIEQRGSAGAMSAIFGEQAALERNSTDKVNRMLDEGDIIDGEIIEPE